MPRDASAGAGPAVRHLHQGDPRGSGPVPLVALARLGRRGSAGMGSSKRKPYAALPLLALELACAPGYVCAVFGQPSADRASTSRRWWVRASLFGAAACAVAGIVLGWMMILFTPPSLGFLSATLYLIWQFEGPDRDLTFVPLGLSILITLTAVFGEYYLILLRRDRVRDIPTSSGKLCEAWEGDAEELVLAKCGKPCGQGMTPKGLCKPRPLLPSELFDLCGNTCSIYVSTAVCYGAGVVAFERLKPPGTWNLHTCEW